MMLFASEIVWTASYKLFYYVQNENILGWLKIELSYLYKTASILVKTYKKTEK